MTHTLNEGQYAAAEAFFQFLFSPQLEFIISGGGGVGKTFLMSHMIDEVLPEYFKACKLTGIAPEYDSVVMCATTNKAAEVLAQATQRPTETIHSFLNLKVQEDFKTGRSELIKTRNWTVHERKIIFIDECSMIDSPLRQLLIEGTHKCKIVYVGDHCQLAPVAEPLSPIYRDELPFYELTEPMRTDNPELLAINRQLRQTVETGVFQPIRIVPGVIDLLDNDQMYKSIVADFSQQTHSTRILAFTNQRVMDYNDEVRIIRGLPDEYTVGEFLVNNSAIQVSRSRMLSVEEEVTVHAVDDKTSFIDIEDDVKMEVRETTITTSIGETFDVLLPVDRNYFAELKKWYARKKNWNRHFYLKNGFPDLRQRDAATVHKAQGSTYDSVYVDLGNISTCNIPNQVARMLYVALSRARTRVYLFGNLTSKYGGLIV